MINKVTNINTLDLEKILSQKSKDVFLAQIYGNEIESVEQLFDVFSYAFNFQVLNNSFGNNWSAFDDMMTDLSNISEEHIILIIHDFDKLLLKKPYEKERLISYLEESILPFWENDVLSTVVDGSAKTFQVYLCN